MIIYHALTKDHALKILADVFQQDNSVRNFVAVALNVVISLKGASVSQVVVWKTTVLASRTGENVIQKFV